MARKVWHALARLREPLSAVAVGVVAFLLVFLVKDYSFIGDEELGVQDRAYLTWADTRPSATVPPFLLVDFTQRDHYELSYPTVTPRDLVARLLTLAASGHPRLIVIDVDLGWPAPRAQEDALQKALSDISGAGFPPVLLVRQPLPRADGPPLTPNVAPPPDTIRATPFDSLLARSSNISWVSALAPVDGDGVTRRYFVSVPVCREGRTQWLPGIQVAACATLEGSAPRLRYLAAGGRVCGPGGAPAIPTAPPPPLRCGGFDWPLGEVGAAVPIAFRMRWVLPSGSARPQSRIAGVPVEEVEIVDALDLVKNAASLDPAAQFGGRIVIVGSSAEHLDDTNRTAIGVMPGMMMLANAIRSAREGTAAPNADFGLSLALTAIMSLVTYLSWVVIRRIRGLGHLVFKELAAPALNVAWMLVVALLLPTSHLPEFLYPQLIVSFYLVFAYAVAEARAGASVHGDRSATP